MKTEIQKLYERIPASHCPNGCARCCINSVQMAREERARMGGYVYTDRCPYLTGSRCGVYADRPLVCRIYGASALLQCGDCVPERLLTEEETLALLRQYNRLRLAQE